MPPAVGAAPATAAAGIERGAAGPPAPGAARGVARVLAEAAAWAVAFGAVSIVYLWPLVRVLPSAFLFPGGQGDSVLARADMQLTTWMLAWGSHALRTAPTQLFDPPIFHPLPGTLAFSEHMLAGVLTVLPIDLLLGAHAIRDHNLLVLATFALGGTGTALLVRELGGGLAAAALAGALFVFHPFRASLLIHVQALSVHWMPFALLCLHRLLRRGRWAAGAAFVAFLLLALLSSVYYLYYVGIAVAALIVFHRAWGCPAAPHAHRRALLLAAAAGLAAIAVMLPYATAREVYALGRLGGEAWMNSARAVVYLAPVLQPLGWFAGRYGTWPTHVNVGPVPLALLVTGLVAGAPGSRGRRLAAAYGCTALVVAVLSLGPLLQLYDLFDPALPGPHALLERIVPGFSALRVPVRALSVAMLPIAVLAAFGFDAIRRRLRSRPARLALAGLVPLVVVAEAWRPRPLVHDVGWAAAPSAVYRWLATEAHDGAVLEIPAGVPLADTRAMLEQPWHWRPLVNGYSGFTPTAEWIRTVTLGFPTSDGVRRLADIGVRWLVVRARELLPGYHGLCSAPLPADLAPWLVRRVADGEACVLEIVQVPPAPAPRPERAVPLDGVRVSTSSGDPAPAHDGDPSTHWVEDVSMTTPGWLQLDLPAARPLTRVSLALGRHFGEYMRRVRVEASDDGTSWTTLVEHPTLTPPLQAMASHPDALAVDVPLPGTPVRHLRLVRLERIPGTPFDHFPNWQRWGVHEIALYEAAG